MIACLYVTGSQRGRDRELDKQTGRTERKGREDKSRNYRYGKTEAEQRQKSRGRKGDTEELRHRGNEAKS